MKAFIALLAVCLPIVISAAAVPKPSKPVPEINLKLPVDTVFETPKIDLKLPVDTAFETPKIDLKLPVDTAFETPIIDLKLPVDTVFETPSINLKLPQETVFQTPQVAAPRPTPNVKIPYPYRRRPNFTPANPSAYTGGWGGYRNGQFIL